MGEHFEKAADPQQAPMPAEPGWNGPRDILSLLHDCVIVRDPAGAICFWNRAAEQLYGWTLAEVRGHPAETVLKTRFPKPWPEIEAELQANGQWEGELVHTARDGRRVIVASRWALTSESNARLQRCVQVERDITEQKRVAEELKQARQALEQSAAERLAELGSANEAVLESQERFRQIGEAIPDVILLTNPSRTSTLYVSPAYQQIWGRSCQSLYADPHSWLEAVHPEDRPRVRQFFAKHASEQGHEQSYRIVRPNCSVRWVLDRGFPVRDQAGVCYRVMGILRDVTQGKELEKEILAISEREQRRMGQDLHDDLCQRLAGTEFLSRALQEQLGAAAQAAKAGEIARLIREAMQYTRLLARGLAPVELAADGLLRGLQALAERTSEHFQVRCRVEAPSVFLVQDPTVSTHLYRIAQEAVANSLKHGGATEISIRLESKAEGGELRVRDNGKGLPPGAQVSTGMGLRIMRYRAEMIGATLAVESPAPGGTTIVCAFPLTAW